MCLHFPPVSDTGQPWEAGYEEHPIPRGIYARSLLEEGIRKTVEFYRELHS